MFVVDQIIQSGETACLCFPLGYFLFDYLVLQTLNKSSLVPTNCFAFLCLLHYILEVISFVCWVHSTLIFYFSEIVRWATTVKGKKKIYTYFLFQSLPATLLPLHQIAKLFTLTSRVVLTGFRKIVVLQKVSHLGWKVKHGLVFTAHLVLLMIVEG